MEENKMREERTESYEEMGAKTLFHMCLDKGIDCPIKKPREYYIELLKGTKTKEEAKQDVIIERIDKVQVQNGIIMSAIGEIMFFMLDKKKDLELSDRNVKNFDNCLTAIVSELESMRFETGMDEEESGEIEIKSIEEILKMIGLM